jgi:REP element-mobilizing transposase RayT
MARISPRAAWWDYTKSGSYFVTICTHNRQHYFGEICNGKMILSNLGILADVFWYEIKNHTENVKLGAFEVMPNHIHGILELMESVEDVVRGGIVTGGNVGAGIVGAGIVGAGHALPLQPVQKRYGNQGKNSLSSIIGSYKSAVTKHANRLNINFGWQTRFHDHIIRDEEEYQRISNYIINNPRNWKDDRFYK